MRHSQHDGPDLAEVKAVLERLHQISRGPHTDDVQLDKKQAPPRELPQPERLAPQENSRPPGAIWTLAPSDRARVTKRRLLQAGGVIAALLVAFAGINRFMASNRPTASITQPAADVAGRDSVAPAAEGATIRPVDPPAAPPTPRAPEPQRSSAALQAASALMTSGQVRAARAELLLAAQEGSADVAWALARSYDPNVLGAIAAADASPDVVEAARWYRTWYDIAVKQGLVADSVSVERIVRSMH
jgi:hypothetical protein